MQQHDGSLRRFQQSPFGFADLDPACQRCDVGRHDRERLGVALLALAEAGDGGGVLGVADQMKTAQSLDRQNLAREQACQRGGDHVVYCDRLTVSIAQSQAGTADRAGVRLRVKAAVVGVAVFSRASRA